MRLCSFAASSGRVHPGHHDGRAGGDGFWGPAAKPAAAEQIQLQPAGCGQRARSDDRQWLVLYPLLTRERGRSAGRWKKETEGDEMQEIQDKERRGGKTGREKIHFCSSTFLPSSLCPSLLWLVQLNGDHCSVWPYEETFHQTLWDTVLNHHPLSVVLLLAFVLIVAMQLPRIGI